MLNLSVWVFNGNGPTDGGQVTVNRTRTRVKKRQTSENLVNRDSLPSTLYRRTSPGQGKRYTWSWFNTLSNTTSSTSTFDLTRSHPSLSLPWILQPLHSLSSPYSLGWCKVERTGILVCFVLFYLTCYTPKKCGHKILRERNLILLNNPKSGINWGGDWRPTWITIGYLENNETSSRWLETLGSPHGTVSLVIRKFWDPLLLQTFKSLAYTL